MIHGLGNRPELARMQSSGQDVLAALARSRRRERHALGEALLRTSRCRAEAEEVPSADAEELKGLGEEAVLLAFAAPHLRENLLSF
jgi:hypothetical protein